MKKILFLSVFMALPFLSFAQAVEQENVEQQVNEQPAVEEEVCYMYNIVTFSGSLNKEGFSIHLDNGKKIKTLKDKDGKNMKFATPAAVLMYLASEGWELYVNGTTTSGVIVNGSGSNSTSNYWIVRKSCTKAELEQAVKEGVK
ncbi:MAG: hypothetical protein J6V47_08625 [Bacteroidaceae bacterium]|nr:hypothetical protein [Bacteroidaceae bacterium]